MDKFAYGGISYYFYGNYNKSNLKNVFSRFSSLETPFKIKNTIIHVNNFRTENQNVKSIGIQNKFYRNLWGRIWEVYDDSIFVYRELPLVIFADTAHENGVLCVNGTVVEINGAGILILYKSNTLKLKLLLAMFEKLDEVKFVSDELSFLSLNQKEVLATEIDGFVYDFGIDIAKQMPLEFSEVGCNYIARKKSVSTTVIKEIWIVNKLEYIDTPIISKLEGNPMQFILTKKWPSFFQKSRTSELKYREFTHNLLQNAENSEINIKQICLNENIIDIFVEYIKFNLEF